MESPAHDANTLETLTILGERLHRLEFLLHGTSDAYGVPETATAATEDQSVAGQLANLEEKFRLLTSRDEVIRKLLDQYAHYPELFLPATDEQVPETLDPSISTSIVLAHASAYAETSSRLYSLKDLSVPRASASAELLDLLPRLEQAAVVQEASLRQVAELRAGSARLLERWLEVGLVGQGEVWAEWEERVRTAERAVRRFEVAREKEGG